MESTSQAPYKLLYYCYAELGPAGRARLIAALETPTHPSLSGQLRCGLDGLNCSLGGPRAALEAHAAHVAALPDLAPCGPIDFKFAPHLASRSDLPESFAAYRVLAVEEIVTLGAGARGERAAAAGRHAPPAEFHALLTGAAPSPPHSLVIDCRNAFESDIGTLVPAPGSNLELLRPPVRRFEDMVAWTEANAAALARAPRIAMFCTGGVRCERYSALVRARFAGADVVQLEGGVQRYMEAAEAGALGGAGRGEAGAAAPAEDTADAASRWQGRLYVFDERPAVRVAGEAVASSPHLPGVLGACVRCAGAQEEYAGHRCAKCRVVVLVCSACADKVAGEGAGQLVCSMCEKGVAWERARTRVRGRRARQARPQCVAEAAQRRAQAAGAGGSEGEVDLGPIAGLFGEAGDAGDA